MNGEISRAKKAEEDLGVAVGAKAESTALASERQRAEAAENDLRARIAALKSFDVRVVNALPATGLANTVYLVPSANSSDRNVKDEYLWINGAWEQIGSTAVDLAEYAKKSEVPRRPGDIGAQNALNLSQLAAVNSGITADKVADIDDKADRITKWVFKLGAEGKENELVVKTFYNEDDNPPRYEWHLCRRDDVGDILAIAPANIEEDTSVFFWNYDEDYFNDVPLIERKRVLCTGDSFELGAGFFGGDVIFGDDRILGGSHRLIVIGNRNVDADNIVIQSADAGFVTPAYIKIGGKKVATEDQLDPKANKLDNTIVSKIDKDAHEDNITIRIARVPIELARKTFNAVKVSFHAQSELSRYTFIRLGIGYSTGDGGSTGVTYSDTAVGYSTNTIQATSIGDHVYRFEQGLLEQIPQDAKFLTFFFCDSYSPSSLLNAPIDAGYATDAEVLEKKYQIQETDGFFHLEHAPLMEFLVVDDPVARKSNVDSVENQTKSALGLSTYPIKAVVNGQLLDRTVNTSTGGAFTFPASGTGARDFVVVVAASATAPSVSFPSSGVTYFSDDDAVWTAEANKLNIWYFTEIAANKFMVAHKALAETTQA